MGRRSSTGIALRLRFGVATTLLLLGVSHGDASAQTPFTEEADARGLDFPTEQGSLWFGQGGAFVDLDNDGDVDVVLVGKTDATIGVFENDGTGNFIDRSSTSGIGAQLNATGLAAADYDDDGDQDLYLTRWNQPNLLLRNDGGFSFVDVGGAAGVADSGRGSGCAWGDYDGDGDLDLYMTTRLGASAPNRLYRNEGDGTFVDVLSAVGLPSDDISFQAIFFDHDFDGDPDLYLSNKCAPTNRLFRNDDGVFVDITVSSGTGACMDSMGIAVGEFNGNGWPDLYGTNLPTGNALFINQGDGTYTDESAVSGTGSFSVGWGANFFDYDNDGHVELFVANEGDANRLYDHDGLWPASDLGSTLGVADPTSRSFGTLVGDVDLDGDQDLIVVNTDNRVRLYINHEGEKRHWLRLPVVGVSPNRFAVGAHVEVDTPNGTQWRELYAGTSYRSHEDQVLHFGLANATSTTEIRARWPDGATRTLAGFPSDRVYTLYPPVRLGDADGDGDVEFDDALGLLGCFTGDLSGSIAPGCEMHDFDGDADVDDSDTAMFFTRYVGPLHDCNDNGVADLTDILSGAEPDDGDGVPDSCQSAGAPAGSFGTGSSSLTLSRATGDELGLSWGASCRAGDGDSAIYEGPLGAFGDHEPVLCSTGGASNVALTPGAGDRFFLVVPHNGAREGAHGDATAGPRLPPPSVCLAQELAACP